MAGASPNVARVLFNPRTTEHMGEVLSKRVRNELVDALLLAEQLRLGSTPEVLLTEDADLLTARLCSRAARDLAQPINRKKNQLRSLVRGATTRCCSRSCAAVNSIIRRSTPCSNTSSSPMNMSRQASDYWHNSGPSIPVLPSGGSTPSNWWISVGSVYLAPSVGRLSINASTT